MIDEIEEVINKRNSLKIKATIQEYREKMFEIGIGDIRQFIINRIPNAKVSIIDVSVKVVILDIKIGNSDINYHVELKCENIGCA